MHKFLRPGKKGRRKQKCQLDLKEAFPSTSVAMVTASQLQFGEEVYDAAILQSVLSDEAAVFQWYA